MIVCLLFVQYKQYTPALSLCFCWCSLPGLLFPQTAVCLISFSSLLSVPLTKACQEILFHIAFHFSGFICLYSAFHSLPQFLSLSVIFIWLWSAFPQQHENNTVSVLSLFLLCSPLIAQVIKQHLVDPAGVPLLHVLGSIIYNNQNMKSTEACIRGWMGKEEVAYIHNGILLTYRKEWNLAFHNHMDGPRQYQAAWINQTQRDKILT